MHSLRPCVRDFGPLQGSALAKSPGSELQKAAAECRQDAEAFAKLLVPHTSLVLQKSEQDTETSMNIMCYVIAAVKPPAASLKLALQMCDQLAAETAHKPLIRVSTMLQLYNTAASADARLAIIMRVLDFARAANASALAPSLHKQAELWEREWKLSAQQRATLFAAVADVLDSHPNAILKGEALMLRSKVLLAAAPGDAAALAEVAHQAILSFLATPGHFSCDLFASAPVQVRAPPAR